MLSQTLQPIELLLVDDGSTDATLEIASEFERRDPRVRVIRLGRKGIAHALNAGIEQARGVYVARMDADDICHPDRLQKQIAHLDANADCVAVGSAIEVMDETGDHVGTSNYPEHHAEITRALLGGRLTAMAHPTVIVRRTALLSVGGYRPASEPSEDIDLWFRLSGIGKLANTQEQLLRYRRHAEAVSIRDRHRQCAVGTGIINEQRNKHGLKPLTPRAMSAGRNRAAAYHYECARIALLTGSRRVALRHARATIASEPWWSRAYMALAACAFPKWTVRSLVAASVHLGAMFPGR